MRIDVQTARPDETLGALRTRLDADQAWFVTTEGGVVLGRLGRRARRAPHDARASAVMTAGPSTYRADVGLIDLMERMRTADATSLPITDPDGRLLGVLYRADAEHALHEAHSRE